MLSLIILILLPGYCFLPQNYPRKLRLSFVIFVSISVTSGLGLILMSLDAFSAPLIALFELPLLGLRWRSRTWPKIALRNHKLVLTLCAALAAFAIITTGEPFDADGDAGVYTISAQHLHHSGSWTWPLDDLIPKAASTRELAISNRTYVNPWDEVAPGFLVRGDNVVPQFLPIYPLWGAIFAAALPVEYEIYGVLAASGLGMLMLLLAAERLFSLFLPRSGVVIALILLASNPILLIFLKYPSAECFLSGLLVGQILFTTLFLRCPKPSSALLPASLLAFAILTKFFAWAVTGGVFLVLFLLPAKRWTSTLPFLFLGAPAVALGLKIAGPHLSNHLGQLMLLDGFKLIMLACVVVVLLRTLWSRIEKWAQFGLASLFTFVLVFLWASGEVSRSGPGRFVHDLFALNGVPFLSIAVLGLVISSLRRRSIAHLLPAFILVLLTSYLVLGSGDTIFYPFAARRFLVITIPLGCMFCASVLNRSRLLGILGTAIIVLPPVISQRDAILVRPGMGFLQTLEQLDEAIADHTVFSTNATWRYTSHLLLSRDRNVFCFDTRRGWRRVEPYLDDHKNLTLLSNSEIGSSHRIIATERRPGIRASTQPPLKTGIVRAEFFLGELHRDDLQPRSILELGDNDDFLITNFHGHELSGQRSYRWTGPSVRLRMQSGTDVRFIWSPGGNPEAPLPARIFANNQHIGFASLKTGWKTSRWFALPDDGNEVIVEIRTHTFRPADLGRSNDQRLLGLRLARVEVRDTSIPGD